MNDSSNGTDRLCASCFHRRPLGDFRRQSKGKSLRRTECKACHNLAERRRRRAQKEKTFRRLVQRLNDPKKPTAAVVGVVNEALRQVGGVEGLAGLWVGLIKGAAGTAAALRGCNALINLLAIADALTQRATAASR